MGIPGSKYFKSNLQLSAKTSSYSTQDVCLYVSENKKVYLRWEESRGRFQTQCTLQKRVEGKLPGCLQQEKRKTVVEQRGWSPMSLFSTPGMNPEAGGGMVENFRWIWKKPENIQGRDPEPRHGRITGTTFFFFFFFLWPYLQHMDVPGLENRIGTAAASLHHNQSKTISAAYATVCNNTRSLTH